MVGFQHARIALFLREYKSTPTCFWMDSGMSFSGAGGGRWWWHGSGSAREKFPAQSPPIPLSLPFMDAAFSIIALLSLV
jgi:hypothetical protein